MLTLQQEPLPVTPSSVFSAPSTSSLWTPNQPPSPVTMAESAGIQHRPRRSPRSPLNPASSSPPSTSSSYATFPKFLSAPVPSAASLSTPVLPSAGSRLKFGESWNDQDSNGGSNLVPESLLNSTLSEGRFIDTFRASPSAVAAVIGSLHGSYELLSFCHVNKQMTELVEGFFDSVDQVRDAFLKRSISGYQPSMSPNPSWLNHAIKIDLTDLELLLESNTVSLAVYPTHALRIIASPHSSASSADATENDNITARFQTLTLSHSRFVAYLRTRTAPQALLLASQDEDNAIVPSPDSSDGPELVFPNPLFYFNDMEPPITQAYLPLTTSTDISQSRSKSRSISGAFPKISKSKSASSLQPSEGERPEMGKGVSRLKRLSVQPRRKSNVVPPPPPSAMPILSATGPSDMGQFGSLGPSSGRAISQSFHERPRSHSQNSIAAPPHTISHVYHSSYSRYTPPSTGQYTPPGSSTGLQTPPPIGFGVNSAPSSMSRRRVRQSFHIPESSSSSGPLGPSQSPRFSSRAALNPSPSPGTATPVNPFDTMAPSSSPNDIHALSQVFRLTRAPIFRVFVPCSRLNRAIRQACMAQLHAASLIPHLRAGDLVCNLGYVPDVGADDPATGNGADLDDGSDCRGWMIWSGYELRPLTTRAAIPVRDPTFLLTTPHYYSHVLLAGENPRFEMAIPLIPAEQSQGYVFSLTREVRLAVAAKKKSEAGEPPKKHKVNRFIWVARVECARWGSEWMIEVEGTKEGRDYLESALRDSQMGMERAWELVRDRTGRGRVYIRKV